MNMLIWTLLNANYMTGMYDWDTWTLLVYRVWPKRVLAFPMTLPSACHPYAMNANMERLNGILLKTNTNWWAPPPTRQSIPLIKWLLDTQPYTMQGCHCEYTCCTFFIDIATQFIFPNFQESMNACETLQGKQQYELFGHQCNCKVHEYC